MLKLFFAPRMIQASIMPIDPPDWGYFGVCGPENWGDLKPDYQLCKRGRLQSPIDIRNAVVSDLPPIERHYTPFKPTVINNGASILIESADKGGGFIRFDNKDYPFQQFHFHTPSEERVEGRGYPMVIHVVHGNPADQLVVLAALVEVGQPNDALSPIFNTMPQEVGLAVPLDVDIDPARLLPESPGYYAFLGSLTTPPCTENVLWRVFKQPVTLSAAQIDAFRTLFPMNARPLQAANNRRIQSTVF